MNITELTVHELKEKIEKADYKLGEDGNVIEFLNLNKDKNIRVEYIGDRTYKTTMSPTDRQAAAGVYELAQILSAMEQIKKEQEEANLKIGFINKKKERKAQEEITKKVMGALTDPSRIRKDDLGNPDVCMVAYYHELFSEDEVKTIFEECNRLLVCAFRDIWRRQSLGRRKA